MPVSYVYSLGRIEPRFPRLSVEKEFAQATGRAETANLTDRQALRRVLVCTVARIDDPSLQMLREQMGRTRHGVPYDDDIDAERLDVFPRVDKRLAFADA